eukprot:gb/GEZN01013503.1/.p1 GENE.gb/GEZN01013503.1/~~gb/GEZN01013503.1/.p1  ORF type:complete len:186 (-),score=24.15 gb/GEZN01013503.1/:356-913(-)
MKKVRSFTAYTGPGSVEMDRERERPTSRNDPLSKVFRLHRYVAGGAGLALMAIPFATKKALSDTTSLPFPEQLVTQWWGCFLFLFALIAHAGPSFPAGVRLVLGRALGFCNALLSVVYVYTVYFEDQGPSRSMHIKVGSLFFFLFLAYCVALIFTPSMAVSFSRNSSSGDLADHLQQQKRGRKDK